MKTFVFAVFMGLIKPFDSFCQNKQYTANDDTLTFFTRTGGDIDTFDLTYTFPLSSLPGGQLGKFNSVPTIDFYKQSPSLFLYTDKGLQQKFMVSGLPHIGFFYSFGTKGTQFLHADYQQTFKNKSLLNLEINRNSSSVANSMVRNGGFSNQSLQGSYRFNSKKFSGLILGKYNQNDLSLNGGISNDSTWIDQGIGFAPVRKTNASSIQKFAGLGGELKYNLLNDSSSLKLGPISKHDFSLWNRVYNEASDTLSIIYPSIYIDSLITRDQFQDSKLKNSLGVFAENNFFSSKVTISHRYWRFQNLGNYRDTNEISGEILLSFKRGKFFFETENYINLVSAKNEYSSKNVISWGSKLRHLRFGLNSESLLPKPVQRFYFSNNLNYSNSLVKQNRTDIHLAGAYSLWKIDGEITVGSLIWKNNLQWSINNWVINDQSEQNINYLKGNFHFDLNWLQFYPEIQLNQGSEYLPKYIISSRLLVKKRVFAAKKLELLLALDPQITDKYKLMRYNTLLDNWYLQESNRVGGQFFSLHSTITFHIEEFRFFIRAENIQSFWTPNNVEIAQDYFRPTFLIRLGLSWDFFN